MIRIIYFGALFLAKLLDNALSTTKTILIQRSRWLLAGISVIVTDFIYLSIISRVVSENNPLALIVVWRTRDFKDEARAFADALKSTVQTPIRLLKKLKNAVNKDSSATPKREKRPPESAGWYVAVGIIFFLSVLLFVAVVWSKATFGIEINEIINTLRGPVEGTGEGMKTVIIHGLVLPMVGVLLGYLLFVLVDALLARRLVKKGRSLRGYHAVHRIISTVAAFSLIAGVLFGNLAYELIDYYAESGSRTTLYEDHYISPDSIAITAGERKRNLIYIYVESLETTYASKEVGGFQSVNYMPRLTELAETNVSFSDNGKLGGMHMLNGTNWTMAALFSTTSAIPYAMAEGDSSVTQAEKYMPGVTTLGDILDQNGYVQEFLCGSDGSFAGRQKFFEQHGNYKVFDVYSAREAGYIPGNYWVNWGIEDRKLFYIAKEELTKLASQGKPFNFTMLTVDLHAKDGYICDECKNDYPGITANVIDCNDRVIAEFLDWCRAQDFYDDTMIVITGDHPRMDTSLVADAPRFQRTVYNCFINSAVEPQMHTKDRVFTSVDVMPTVLAGLGFTVEGDRIGLGTNLFSQQKTLAEQKGFDWLYQETSKPSRYYMDTFQGQ